MNKLIKIIKFESNLKYTHNKPINEVSSKDEMKK
jgi:hypothetical protein